MLQDDAVGRFHHKLGVLRGGRVNRRDALWAKHPVLEDPGPADLWPGILIILRIGAVTPAEAAGLMIWVSLCGFLGRLVFSYLSDAIGRRPSGMIIGFLGALLMALAGPA